MMTNPTLHRTPLLAAGILLGAGLGGFVDGIVLHQILQWHNMLSSKLPPDTLVAAKVNMYWDGVFHAGVWVLTALGLRLLWAAGCRPDVPWSGRTLLGGLLLGWGLFNVVEGIIDHMVLGLHHVHEYTAQKLPWDLAFLAFGALLLLAGWALVRAGRHDTAVRGAAVR
ncbi:DUF2243 domain-containing protein [Hymenobacter psychrotolerans]|uniref:Uncharacterized membrane protein n=1 Tax=Hymenobacter psychrotolerans DSM 18569 TaxID=1121959 RepID=A0A1M6YFF1_9BACT|nr:DUF2243 domain-containing protein [Hymenobacter psychrotolerans]SHL17034.1 Uncharacterized membrane protein [Hymenobacter psychrotolerans DSM 18569]